MTTGILLAAIALLVTAWWQALHLFARGRWERRNPVIRWAFARWGLRGVDGYFACWIAAVLLADAFVPYGFALAAVVVVFQAVVVIRNHRRGIKL